MKMIVIVKALDGRLQNFFIRRKRLQEEEEEGLLDGHGMAKCFCFFSFWEVYWQNKWFCFQSAAFHFSTFLLYQCETKPSPPTSYKTKLCGAMFICPRSVDGNAPH